MQYNKFVLEREHEKQNIVGVDDAEGPPVPIPNTEVKLSGAENTWLATAREDRSKPTPLQEDKIKHFVFLFHI